MALLVTFNGESTGNGFLIAPDRGRVCPAPLGLKTDDGTRVEVRVEVSPPGAGVYLDPPSLYVDGEEKTVWVHPTGPGTARDDTVLHIFEDDVLEATVNLTIISNPRVLFDGRFEVRFSTGAGFYNHPRGNPDGTGRGWMWALEGEPDFVPADSVPDRLDKAVGRALHFHNPAVNRSHVPPIGVFVRAIEGTVGGATERFASGDPIIGQPVNLGPNSFFASNQPADPADRAAGRLPEERHNDGFQPIANFEYHLGTAFSGSSRIGPFVPGTTESSTPRTPDDRPYASGLVALTAAEQAAYPFPALADFAQQRVQQLVPDLVALKEAGQTNTAEFRDLLIRIGHLLPRVSEPLRSQILADHSGDGLVQLSPSAGFAWGNKEVYRGLINDQLQFNDRYPPMLTYLSRFDSLHFLCVFFNFHTDEDRAHTYGAIDPSGPPPTS